MDAANGGKFVPGQTWRSLHVTTNHASIPAGQLWPTAGLSLLCQWQPQLQRIADRTRAVVRYPICQGPKPPGNVRPRADKVRAALMRRRLGIGLASLEGRPDSVNPPAAPTGADE